MEHGAGAVFSAVVVSVAVLAVVVEIARLSWRDMCEARAEVEALRKRVTPPPGTRFYRVRPKDAHGWGGGWRHTAQQAVRIAAEDSGSALFEVEVPATGERLLYSRDGNEVT